MLQLIGILISPPRVILFKRKSSWDSLVHCERSAELIRCWSWSPWGDTCCEAVSAPRVRFFGTCRVGRAHAGWPAPVNERSGQTQALLKKIFFYSEQNVNWSSMRPRVRSSSWIFVQFQLLISTTTVQYYSNLFS